MNEASLWGLLASGGGCMDVCAPWQLEVLEEPGGAVCVYASPAVDLWPAGGRVLSLCSVLLSHLQEQGCFLGLQDQALDSVCMRLLTSPVVLLP